MSTLSRRNLLAGAGLCAGAGASSLLLSSTAMADGYEYVWKRTLSPGGPVVTETLDSCLPDQSATCQWIYDYGQAPGPLYVTTELRKSAAGCYVVAVANEGSDLLLRLEHRDSSGAKPITDNVTVPVSSCSGRRKWVLRSQVTGSSLEASLEGVPGMQVSATDARIKEGSQVAQTFYLSRRAKQSTNVRGTSIKATSTGETFSRLIFEDNFDTGTDLDPTKWAEHYPDWNPGYVGYDWGVITHDTHDVKDGLGRFFWRKRSQPITGKWPNKHDESAGVATVRDVDTCSVVTRDLFSFTYGRVEARIRFPQSHAGLWAGVWMRPTKGADGEIDIVESWGGGANKGSASADVHYTYDNVPHRHNPRSIEPRPDLTQFHLYAMEKTPERITFFFDGVKYHEVTSQEYPDRWAKAFGPGTPYYLRVCSQAGDSPQTKIDTTTFTEASVDIDYIRVWQMDQ